MKWIVDVTNTVFYSCIVEADTKQEAKMEAQLQIANDNCCPSSDWDYNVELYDESDD